MAIEYSTTSRSAVTGLKLYENDTAGPGLLTELRRLHAMEAINGNEEDRIGRDTKAVLMRIQNLRLTTRNAPIRAQALMAMYGSVEELLHEDDTPAGYLKAQLVSSIAQGNA